MILLLGSSGYVGTEFMRQLDSYVTIKHTDIVDENFLREFIRDNEIELVINCAGYVGKPNVDACETQREETFDGNVLFPLMVQRACSGIATLGVYTTKMILKIHQRSIQNWMNQILISYMGTVVFLVAPKPWLKNC